MSPHALPVQEDGYGSDATTADVATRPLAHSISTLQRHDNDEVHDLVCVGFGPASLAIAVALQDALESGDPHLVGRRPKVRFMEKQGGFAWHAGMLLPGAKMQITFVKDLATMRNPRSNFTFLNYLHQNHRLLAFTNLGTFLPQRIEYEDYMRWCADHFRHLVDYSQDVQQVAVGGINAKTGAIEHFEVSSVNHDTGRETKVKAKHVVIAAGGQPNMPSPFSQKNERVIHSSQYATMIDKIFPPGTQPRSVAVIGAGQSAAEVFFNIPKRFPGAQSHLLIRGAALKPSDDSPFVNEIFNPERVDDIFSQASDVRMRGIALDKATNYGVVRLELLEEIYADMYSYRIKNLPEKSWPHRILNYRTITGVTDGAIDGRPGVRLDILDDSGQYCAHKPTQQESLTVDLVIVATGYIRNAHESMLSGLRGVMLGGDRAGKRWTVARDYALQFEKHAVQPDAGVFLQGCNEETHGLSDSLLSILAIRGGEMVSGIFGPKPSA